MVGTLGDRIYKLSAQFDSSIGGTLRLKPAAAEIVAAAAYAESCRFCDEQFGKRSGTAGGAGVEWGTPFGNVVLDRRVALGTYYVNFQCTDGSLVSSGIAQNNCYFRYWVRASQ